MHTTGRRLMLHLRLYTLIVTSCMLGGFLAGGAHADIGDMALLPIRLHAIRHFAPSVRLSNGDVIDTTTTRGMQEALDVMSQGTTDERQRVADAFYGEAWNRANGNRDVAQEIFQILTGLPSIHESNQWFAFCATRAPQVERHAMATASHAAHSTSVPKDASPRMVIPHPPQPSAAEVQRAEAEMARQQMRTEADHAAYVCAWRQQHRPFHQGPPAQGPEALCPPTPERKE